MEKFINNLYSNSNFPVVLFSLIGIFIVLFIITLILALRDARKSSKEIEENTLKKEDKDSVKEEVEEPLKEETKEEEKPIIFEDINFNDDVEEEKKEDVVEASNDITFTDLEDKEEVKEDILNEPTTKIPTLDNDDISNFENFFLENLKEEEKEEDIYDFSNDDIELPKRKDE